MLTKSQNDIFPNHVCCFSSSSDVDFSEYGLHRSLLAEHQQRLEKITNVSWPLIYQVRQVHGVDIHEVIDDDPKATLWVGDGLLTRKNQIGLAVRTADCIPVFFYDQENDGIGVLHAGWKGLALGIVQKMMDGMHQRWQTQVDNVRIQTGAFIQSCCFEVDEAFSLTFKNYREKRQERWFVDLAAILMQQLQCLGINDKHVFISQLCSCCSDQWHSYRRDGQRAGRILNVIAKGF